MCAVLATSPKPLPSPPVTVSPTDRPGLNRSRARERGREPLKNEGKNITAGTNFGADVTSSGPQSGGNSPLHCVRKNESISLAKAEKLKLVKGICIVKSSNIFRLYSPFSGIE